MNLKTIWVFLSVLSIAPLINSDSSKPKPKRYIFFDVNPGEGFNLRRDVFMRIAVFVKKLRERGADFTLVLPPWGRIYHWQTKELGRQTKIPWKQFFDIESINRFVPVLDLEDYLVDHKPEIDLVLYLQNYVEGWTSGEYVEKYEFRDCLNEPRYHQEETTGLFQGWFWDYSEIRAKDFKCLSVQGSTKVIQDLVLNRGEKTILLDRAETLLHDWFGDENYWAVRRSMRFAQPLIDIANKFRREQFHSDDEKDDLVMAKNWEDHRPVRTSARGGNYMCVHLRRKDYVYARKNQIPSIESAAEQVKRKLDQLSIKSLFVATDAPLEEFEEFIRHIGPDYNVVRFVPTDEILTKHQDGGVAIIDQIICSASRYFLGSPESTFTFRIQEEREIRGYDERQTFDMLCPTGKFNCEKGSVWKIVYPKGTFSSHTEL